MNTYLAVFSRSLACRSISRKILIAKRTRSHALVFWRPRCATVPGQARWNSSKDSSADKDPVQIKPKLQITFTCKACDHRSSHEMTRQAYTRGTVLIQCPSCKNRHLIADNLKVFSDRNINIEDILREKGQTIQKGYLRDGDIELLPDEDEIEETKSIA